MAGPFIPFALGVATGYGIMKLVEWLSENTEEALVPPIDDDDNENDILSLLVGYEKLLNFLEQVMESSTEWLKQKISVPSEFGNLMEMIIKLRIQVEELVHELQQKVNSSGSEEDNSEFKTKVNNFLRDLNPMFLEFQKVLSELIKRYSSAGGSMNDFVKQFSRDSSNNLIESKRDEN